MCLLKSQRRSMEDVLRKLAAKGSPTTSSDSDQEKLKTDDERWENSMFKRKFFLQVILHILFRDGKISEQSPDAHGESGVDSERDAKLREIFSQICQYFSRQQNLRQLAQQSGVSFYDTFENCIGIKSRQQIVSYRIEILTSWLW